MGVGPPGRGREKERRGSGEVGRGEMGREGEGLSPRTKSWLRPC